MRFTWDPAKSERNIQERGLDFADAQFLWDAPLLAWIDTRRDYGEVREAGLGVLHGRVMSVCWVKRGEDHTHIFSFRIANAREKKRYQNGLAAQNARAAEGDEAAESEPN